MEKAEELKQIMDETENDSVALPDDSWRPLLIGALYSTSERPLFITMENGDALAILAADCPATGLHGADNYRLLLELLRERRTDKTLIISDDGTGAVMELADGLAEINVPYVLADLSGDYDSPDDFYAKDPDNFRAILAETERKAKKPDAVADYIAHDMAAEIDKIRLDAGRKTGFSNLDDLAGSLYPGLYFIGGISSIGKTSFIAQLADQLAERGEHVLFFSLEQSRLEMVSKSIARRIAADKGADLCKPCATLSLQIRTGKESAPDAAREYAESVGDRISIIEGNFYCNPPYIAGYARDYILKNHRKPIIIIDYLQVMTAAADPDTGRKPTDPRQIIDANIVALKRISRSLDVPVLVVSSLNRSNYLTPLDFESFKESGAIEYTADVIWGLQLAAIHETLFDSDPKKDVTEKRERISAAKLEIPRKIELCCLKNRYGASRYCCAFDYYPQYDYFIPDTDFRPAGDAAPFPDDARPAPDEPQHPFLKDLVPR